MLGPRPDEPGPPIGGPADLPAGVGGRAGRRCAAIIARYPQARSALLPLLHLVQAEDGYLTAAGIAFCARQLGLTDAEVTAVATFYSMYRRTPTGTYLVGVCTNTLCAIMGGDAILEALENHLGVHARPDHRRRPDHPRACRVQRRLRLRARGDGQLGVLRQPNPFAAPAIWWTACGPASPSPPPAAGRCARSPTPPAPSRGWAHPATTRRVPGAATLAGLRVAQALDMTAPAMAPASTEDSRSQSASEPAAGFLTRSGTRRGGRRGVHPRPACPRTGYHRAR